MVKLRSSRKFWGFHRARALRPRDPFPIYKPNVLKAAGIIRATFEREFARLNADERGQLEDALDVLARQADLKLQIEVAANS